ncbi:HYR domain-containing protein [uncultured Sunxiuqinia sp.]|uniref:HYR domain-containing protein n=1 Tax=uncultured Sunxiuqinia sp. TaxID=1573825 RepID=UPI00261B2226|nr:HYR domain-containing protein [uncultured Sunxiuqinia sp.]
MREFYLSRDLRSFRHTILRGFFVSLFLLFAVTTKLAANERVIVSAEPGPKAISSTERLLVNAIGSSKSRIFAENALRVENDLTPPTVLTKNISLALDENGRATLTPQMIDAGSFDDVGITEMTLDVTSFDCSQLGEHTVTLTARDAAGKSTSVPAVVTVVDNTPPVLLNSKLTLVLDAQGKAIFTPEDYSFETTLTMYPNYTNNEIIVGGFTADGPAPEDLDGLFFTLDGTSYHQLFFYYNGSSNYSHYFIDTDGSNYALNVQDLFGKEPGEFTLKFTLWKDNCGEVQPDLTPRTFGCEEVGDHPLSLTLTDAQGNSREEMLTITVTDTIHPVFSAQNLTLHFENDAADAITIAPEDLVIWATDNCGIQEPVLSRSTFSPKDAGENNVTVTLSDAHGNTVEQTVVVTVAVPDNTPPVVLTQDITVELDQSGKASIGLEQIDKGSTDNLRITELTLDQSSFDCSQLGNNTVMLTAWDAAGNSASTPAVVTVVDNRAPVLPAKNLTLMLDADGKAVFTPEDFSFEMTFEMYLFPDNLIQINDFKADGLTPEDLDGLYFRLDGSSYHQLFFQWKEGRYSYFSLDTDGDSPTPNPVEIFGKDNGEFTLSISPWYDNCSMQLTASKEVFSCNEVGDHEVTLTATDASGNASSQQTIITVVDNTPPSLSTNNFTIVLDANGKADFTPEDYSFETTLMVYPNVPYNDIHLSGFEANGPAPEDLDGLYFTLNGYTYHQLFFHSKNASRAYYYIDLNRHSTTPNSGDIFGDTSGEHTLNFAPWKDNCGDVQVELSQQEFTCADVGNNEIVLTARDVNGNEATAAITVADTIRPALSVQNFTVNFKSDAAEAITITSADLVVEATDNCGIQEPVLSRSTFSPKDAGANEVIVTLTDTHGNTVEQRTIVTVTAPDDTPPVALAQDITVELEQSGTVNISPEQIDNGSTDNLRITELLLDQSSFDCSQLGEHTVTLTARDAAGNSASATAVVTVIDNLPPALVNSNLTLMLDADGKATFTPEDYSFEVSLTVSPFYSSNQVVIGGFMDGGLTPEDLDGLSFTLDGYTFHRLFLAYNYNSYSYVYNIDKDGYSSTPNARDIFGDTFGEVSFKFALWYDNCGEVQSDLVARTFSCEDLGDNPLPLTLTDAHGNRMEETLTITVTDTIRPVLSVQNFTVNFESDAAEAITITSADLVVEATDNCGIQEPVLSRSTFSPKDAGENEVTVTLTDTHGNTVEQRTIVTVTAPDDTPPVVLTQDLTLELDRSGKASISPEQIDNGSTDNLRITELSLDQSSFDCSQLGNNTVTLTAWDAAGNSSSATALVTVVDKLAPSLPTGNLTLMLDADGKAVLTPEEFSFEMTLEVFPAPANGIEVYGFKAGGLTPEELDGLFFSLDGVTYHQLFFYGKRDEVAAYLIDSNQLGMTPNAQEIFGEAYGEFTLSLTPFYDNCGMQLTVSKEVFSCEEVGDHEITLTATDDSGNESIQQTILTVLDTILPKLTVQNLELALDANGNATISAKDLVVEATDNCGIQDTLLSQSEFSHADEGGNEVIVTLVDVHGNRAEQTAVISIPDLTPPTVLMNNISLDLDETGSATLTPEMIDAGSSDNVGITEMTLDITSFDCSQLGEHTVTLTARDAAGNSASATAVVTVVDNTPPGLSTNNFTIVLDANGKAAFRPEDFSFEMALTVYSASTNSIEIYGFKDDGLVPEDLDGLLFTIDGSTFHQLFLNPHYLGGSYYYIDTDGFNPTLNAQDLFGKAYGEFTLNFASWYDNCGDVQVELSQQEFTCADVGNNEIVLTARDANGNEATAAITVTDTIRPALSVQNFTVNFESDAAEAITITSADLVVEATDNCGIQETVLSRSTFSPKDAGANEVIVTLTDRHGNTVEQRTIVTVTAPDDTPPVALAQDITVELEQSGTVNISPEQIDNGSTDNLRITELTLDQSSFDCSQLGDHTVSLTAWDAAGNSASATAVVTVIDNLPPALVTRNLTLVLDAEGKTVFAPEDHFFEMSLSVYLYYSHNSYNEIVVSGFKDEGPRPEDLDGLYFTLDGSNFYQLFLYHQHSTDSYLYHFDSGTNNSSGNIERIFDETDKEYTLSFALWYDNCGEVLSDLVARTFSCEDLGDNPLPLTLTDSHGNRMEETLTITVTDTIRPVLSVQNFTVNFESDAAEAITITSADLVVEATDVCGTQDTILSRTTFSPTDAGENEVTVTLTDTHGNTVEQRAIVTVTAPDDTPPVALTQNLILELDQSGKASISPEQIDNGSTDNLRITEFSLDQSSFDCSQLGDNTVTLTAWDAAGNSNSGTAVVTVVDNTPPALPSKNLTLMLDADGKAVLRAEDFSFEMTLEVLPFYTDNRVALGGFSPGSPAPGDLDGFYFTLDGSTFHQLFFIRTDYSTSYYYIDTDRYSLTPNAQGIFGKETGEFTLNFIPFYDNCGMQLTASKEVFNCEEVGDHEVTLTATDGSGNESIQQTIITVMDTISPKLTVQPMEATLDADGNATIRAKDLVVEATDNCGIQDTLLSQTVFSQADAGEQEIIVTLVDVHGNSVEQTAVVTIPDIIPPTISLPANSTVASAADQCGARVNYLEEVVDVSVLDANMEVSGSVQWQSFKAGETGRLTKLQLHLNGPVTPMFKLVIFEGTGVAGKNIYSVDYQGESHDRGWLDVSIPYADAPMLMEGASYTFQIEGTNLLFEASYPGVYSEGQYYSSFYSGSYDVDLAFKVSVATGIVALDNSGEVAITQTAGLPSGSVFPLGTTTNTFEFTDWGGNTVQSSFTITVEDQTPPTLVTENISLELDANGAATIKPEDVIIDAMDNCGIGDQVISQTAFDCANLGDNEVLVTVTDQSGNESKATVMVRVVDVTNPAIAQKEAITVIAEPGACSAVVNFDLPVVHDACGASLEQIAGLASGSEFPLGTTELVFRATDNSGNTTTSSFQVNVESINQAPGLDALENLMVPAHQTSVELVLTGIHAGADCEGQRVESIVVDVADPSMVTATQVDYTPGEETARVSLSLAEGQSGETTISIRLKDNGGTANGGLDETQASFTLRLLENQAPEVTGENLTIYVDKNSSVTEDLSANLFSDADEGDRLSYHMSLEDGTTLPAWANFNPESVELTVAPTETELGEHRFKLTATDLSGASASIEVLVVVQIPTGLDELTESMSLKVYPNPSRGMVQVAIQAENSLEVELSVCNLLGQEIHRKSYFLSEPIQLNLSNQMDGVYLIQVKLGTSILTRKVILRK